jgi:hypothetical protein
VVTLGVLHALGTLDGAFAGYRAMAGRCGLIRRGRISARALAWGALWAQLALLLVEGPGLLLGDALDLVLLEHAGQAMAAVYLAYGALVALAYGLRVVPSVDVAAATSLLLFGPLTLLRPVVLLGGVLSALWVYPDPRVAGLGALVLGAALGLGRALALDGERWR